MKIEISLSVIGVKFLGERKKKFVVNKVLWIISYNNVNAHISGPYLSVSVFRRIKNVTNLFIVDVSKFIDRLRKVC